MAGRLRRLLLLLRVCRVRRGGVEEYEGGEQQARRTDGFAREKTYTVHVCASSKIILVF